MWTEYNLDLDKMGFWLSTRSSILDVQLLCNAYVPRIGCPRLMSIACKTRRCGESNHESIPRSQSLSHSPSIPTMRNQSPCSLSPAHRSYNKKIVASQNTGQMFEFIQICSPSSPKTRPHRRFLGHARNNDQPWTLRLLPQI